MRGSLRLVAAKRKHAKLWRAAVSSRYVLATMEIMALLLMAAAPAQAPAPDEDAVIQAWTACLTAQTDRLAIASREPADTIADGALGLCSDKQAAVQQLYVRISGANAQSSGVWIRGHVEEWRRRLIGAVLDRRTRVAAPVRRKKR